MIDASMTWWNRIPVAIDVHKQFTGAILDGKHIQYASCRLPWNGCLENLLREEISHIRFDAFWGDAIPDDMPLLDYVVEYLGIEFAYNGSFQSISNELPMDGIVWWFRNLSQPQIDEVEMLIRDANKFHIRTCIIYETSKLNPIKNTLSIRPDITNLEIQYFAWNLLMEQPHDVLSEYKVALAVAFSAHDPEQCAICCEHIDELTKDPLSVFDCLSSDECFSRTLTAQIRYIEPILELGRLKLIRGLDRRIENLLPFNDEYGNDYQKTEQVELRHMIFFRNQSLLALRSDENQTLNLLYEARNRLSHVSPLSSSELIMLLRDLNEIV